MRRVNRRMAKAPGGLSAEHAMVGVNGRVESAGHRAPPPPRWSCLLDIGGGAGRVGWLGDAVNTSL
ncbi:hypothetical protein BN126360384 [Stenotrophomonas indicatrix]|nr:hypothetical protein BN126360384 [Stenotrophomonas indicatrix]